MGLKIPIIVDSYQTYYSGKETAGLYSADLDSVRLFSEDYPDNTEGWIPDKQRLEGIMSKGGLRVLRNRTSRELEAFSISERMGRNYAHLRVHAIGDRTADDRVKKHLIGRAIQDTTRRLAHPDAKLFIFPDSVNYLDKEMFKATGPLIEVNSSLNTDYFSRLGRFMASKSVRSLAYRLDRLDESLTLYHNGGTVPDFKDFWKNWSVSNPEYNRLPDSSRAVIAALDYLN